MAAHRFPHQSLQELIAQVFVAAACEPHEASVVADHLIQANLTGHDSHGVIRTPIYVRWLNEGKVRANQRLAVIFENDTVAVVDGQMGLGQSIAEQAMTLGIQKTKKSGVAIIAIVGGIALSAVLILLGPRLLAPLGRLAEREHAAGQPVSSTVLAAALMLFTLSAWFADFIGLHAVFGSFLIGTAMPRGVFAVRLKQLLEPFALVFLLPVFFTYSGLNTQLTMVNTAPLLIIALGLLAASIFAKFVACWAAARLGGLDNRKALGIGALMNARGLTELIILNIGLSAGIIGPALFSMLVMMAIVTTLMASPLFEWVYGRAARERGELPPLKGLR